MSIGSSTLVKTVGVLSCTLYLLMPHLQVSGELLHNLTHALDTQANHAHHHHELHHAIGNHSEEEHLHPKKDQGHHHHGPTTGHMHKEAPSQKHLADHDHDFILSLQKLLNPVDEQDHEEYTFTFQLDKHLQPLGFKYFNISYSFSERFHMKSELPLIFIEDEGKPPQPWVST